MGQLPEKFKLDRMIGVKESNEIKVRRFLSSEEKKIIGRMGDFILATMEHGTPFSPFNLI